MAGTKHDTGKHQLSLIPIEGLQAAADALAYGAKKYNRNNYKGGLAHSRLLDAALRHLNQYASGAPVDTESGTSHIGHAIASLSMLCYMIVNRPDLNDVTEMEKGWVSGGPEVIAARNEKSKPTRMITEAELREIVERGR